MAPTKYIIYARISSENQRPESVQAYCSLDTQVQLCKEFITREGGRLLSVYQEVCSASDMKKQLLTSIIKNNSNIVIVTYDATRLTRNVSDFREAYELASSRKIRFATAIPPQIHTLETLLPYVRQSEEEGKAIGRRISAAIQTRKRSGAFVGSVAPFGKRIIRRQDNLRVLVNDEREQKIIRVIKLLSESGSSCKEIGECLTAITGKKVDFKIYEWIVDPVNPSEMMTVETKYKNIPEDGDYSINEIYNLFVKYEIQFRGKNITKSQIKKIYSSLGTTFISDLSNAIDTLNEMRNEVVSEVRNEVVSEVRNEVRNENPTQNNGYFFFYKEGAILPPNIPKPPSGYTGYIWISN